MLKVDDLLAPVNTGVPHVDAAWAQIQRLVKDQFLEDVRGQSIVDSMVRLTGERGEIDGLQIVPFRADLKVRKSYAQALSDMMTLGIGYYRPGPDTIETAPDLECWSHRDRR